MPWHVCRCRKLHELSSIDVAASIPWEVGCRTGQGKEQGPRAKANKKQTSHDPILRYTGQLRCDVRSLMLLTLSRLGRTTFSVWPSAGRDHAINDYIRRDGDGSHWMDIYEPMALFLPEHRSERDAAEARSSRGPTKQDAAIGNGGPSALFANGYDDHGETVQLAYGRIRRDARLADGFASSGSEQQGILHGIVAFTLPVSIDSRDGGGMSFRTSMGQETTTTYAYYLCNKKKRGTYSQLRSKKRGGLRAEAGISYP